MVEKSRIEEIEEMYGYEIEDEEKKKIDDIIDLFYRWLLSRKQKSNKKLKKVVG